MDFQMVCKHFFEFFLLYYVLQRLTFEWSGYVCRLNKNFTVRRDLGYHTRAVAYVRGAVSLKIRTSVLHPQRIPGLGEMRIQPCRNRSSCPVRVLYN
jgi:hypothetical protein